MRAWAGRRTVTGPVVVGVLLAVGIGAAAFAVGPPGHHSPPAAAPASTPASTTPAPAPDVVEAGRITAIGAGPRDVAFSPDGQSAYVTSAGPDVVKVVDTAAGRVRDTIVLDAPPQDVLVSPDGQRLYVTEPGAVVVIDPATGAPVSEIPAGPNPGRPALTPDGALMLVPDQDDATLTIIDTAGAQVRATVALDGPSTAVAVTPDGQRAFAADAEDGLVSVIDVATGQLHGDPLRTGALPDAIAAGPNGVAVANYDAGTVSLVAPYGPTGPAVVAQLEVGENPQALAFAPDGRTLYVTDDATASLLVVDTVTRRVRATRRVGVGPVSVAVSRTGLVYVVNARDRTLSVLRAPAAPTPGKGEG